MMACGCRVDLCDHIENTQQPGFKQMGLKHAQHIVHDPPDLHAQAERWRKKLETLRLWSHSEATMKLSLAHYQTMLDTALDGEGRDG